jgi:hypothetical protein
MAATIANALAVVLACLGRNWPKPSSVRHQSVGVRFHI